MIKASLAGHCFLIENKYPYIEGLFSDYRCDKAAEYTISVTEEEILSEDGSGGFSPAYLESLAVYRKICELLIEQNIILFHSSAIRMDGAGYLFTAPSGVGKSTHAALWRECFGERAEVINDDKPLIEVSDTVTVYGTPYGGKGGLHKNISAPVGGIVILHQAKENTIRRITPREAFPLLFNQTYRPREVEKTFRAMELIQRLLQLPVYSMGCTISREAAELAYNTLRSKA